jgi:hypothetical protein
LPSNTSTPATGLNTTVKKRKSIGETLAESKGQPSLYTTFSQSQSSTAMTPRRPPSANSSTPGTNTNSTHKYLKKKLLSCTACSHTGQGHIAELAHPLLHVPICGTCHAHYRQRDTAVYDKNEVSCVWCGEGDGANLLMCDTCVLAYCEHCVLRNFGDRELRKCLQVAQWQCYVCVMPEMFRMLQVSEELVYYSLYSAYTAIKPPKETQGKSAMIYCVL